MAMSQPRPTQMASDHSRAANADARTSRASHEWRSAIEALRMRGAKPAEYRAEWAHIFPAGNAATAARAAIWYPDDDALLHSNLARWMAELQIETSAAFHRWSIDRCKDFWVQAVRRLGIRMASPPADVADFSRGGEHAVWFPGAQMNIVESCFQAEPGQPAIVSQSPGQAIRRTSYGELREQTNRVSNSIRRAGWGAGDRLAVVLPMTAWSVPIYLGIIQAGCAVVSIADSFASEEIANRLRIADARAVFTYDRMNRSGKSIPLYERVSQSTDKSIVVLPLDAQEPRLTLRTQDRLWQDFLAADSAFEPIIADRADCINVLFSSGTTGDPKAIVWNHLTPLKCAVDGYLHQDIRPNDVVVWPTNLGWMMGPWLIFATLINRGTVGLFEDAPLSPEFGRFVQDVGVRMLGVVPSLVKAWRGTGCMESFDWRHIHLFSSTGETSHPEDMFYLSSLAGMRPIIEYCGGTEIGGGYITSTIVQPNYASAFNSPAMGIDFVIVDSNGVPADEGELFLSSPSIGLSSELLNRDHHQTYFAGTPPLADTPFVRRHGDHFRRLANGTFTAGGRVDDTMNLGGIKISSAELERCCNRVAGVKETAAVALAPEHGPEQLVLFAVLDPTASPNTDWRLQFNQALRDHLNPLFKVARVVLVDSLPRTASNKIMRRALRDQLT